MASLKVNRGLYIITACVVAGLFAMFTVSNKARKNEVAVVVKDSGKFMTRAPTPKTADADTTSDTISAIGGHLENVEKKVESTNLRAELLEKERKQALAQNNVIANRFETRLNEFTEEVESKNDQQMSTLLKKMDELIVATEQKALADASENSKSINVAPESRDSLLQVAGTGSSYGFERGEFVPGDLMLDVYWIEPLDDSLAARSGQAVASVAVGTEANVSKRGSLTALTNGLPTKILQPLERHTNRVTEFVNNQSSKFPARSNSPSIQKLVPVDDT